ncbi:hypothetical protein C0J52_10471 [Blattella germanica]|nr:hypothetical protein C0J52_10471 [Blattella germanica]
MESEFLPAQDMKVFAPRWKQSHKFSKFLLIPSLVQDQVVSCRFHGQEIASLRFCQLTAQIQHKIFQSISIKDCTNQKAMPTNWYKMAAIMNPYCENYEIEEVWEAGCAFLVPERSKLR